MNIKDIKVDNKKVLTLTMGIVAVLGAVIALSYSYFTSPVEGNELASSMFMRAVGLTVTFNDSSEINIDNMLPGQSVSKTFNVNNTGEGNFYYDLLFTNVESTIEGTDVVYTLTSTNSGGSVSETVLPTASSPLVTGILIPRGVSQEYTLTITYKNNPIEDQSNNIGAIFNGQIQLVSPYVEGTNTVREVAETFNYNYPTEDYQTFTVQVDGWYQVEAWGAQGGSGAIEAGKGGYVSGKIYLTAGEHIYVYVGEQGKTITSGTTYYASGGYNGGGIGGNNSAAYSMGGGGATDIRLVSGDWENATSLNSRILVAGGGGGGTSNSMQIAGSGGELIAEKGTATSGTYSTSSFYTSGGTQIAGGINAHDDNKNGLFGFALQNTVIGYGGGGGGGFYGGAQGFGTGGGGGSSFISGYAGVASIIEGSVGDTRDHTTTYTNSNGEEVEIIDTLHYSGKYFVDGEMQAGVNSGNGSAKITYLGSTLERVNIALNNVRYIKDCATGNPVDGHVRWDEIQAIDENGVNVAFGKNVIDYTVDEYPTYPYSRITDGLVAIVDLHAGTLTNAQGVNRCVTVDLGATYDLNEIAVWHMASEIYPTYQPYYNNYTRVSSDNTNWTTILSTTEPETSQGKRVSAYDDNIEFGYTGDYQIFTVPRSGYYQIEAWGAQGGSYNQIYHGGKGAYTSGVINLSLGDELYIYVGGEGVQGNTELFGGYNGGGDSSIYPSYTTSVGTGGGATDVRYFANTILEPSDLEWDSPIGLISRIMVAGGGGGSDYTNNSGRLFYANGGNGGNLIGINGSNVCSAVGSVSGCGTAGSGGMQTIGGYSLFTSSNYALFGIGASSTTNPTNSYGAGGGGGYYGGGSSSNASNGGGGGSSFISGYAGVASIIEGSVGDTIDHTTSYVNSIGETVEIIDTLHYSEKYFVDGEMQAGVNSGNGSAKITYLGSTLERVNTALNNVRYIKDCINGAISTGGQSVPNNHWVELEAIVNGTNVAKGKVGTLYDESNAIVTAHASWPFRHATDGDITSSKYASGSTQAGYQCFVIDLGSEQNLDEVAVWHYWADGRTYNSNVTSVAGSNGGYRTVINTTEPETSQGKRISAYD